MDKSRFFTATVWVAALTIPTIANAALIGRLAATEGGTDYQAYYDTEADLTWLTDANYAMTSGHDSDGMMIWREGMDWAASLNVDGVIGWRLPDTLQPDVSCYYQNDAGVSYGLNCSGSEMGNLFYNVLGGSAGSSIIASHNSNYELFSNVQSSYYWSATEYPFNINVAWFMNMDDGFQDGHAGTRTFYAWAVHSGDVSAVPVPAAVWLFGSGLIGLFGLAKVKAINGVKLK